MWLAGLWIVLLARFPLKFLREPSTFLMDVELYWTTGRRALAQQGLQLYDPVVTQQMLFKYAPIWAVAFIPFAPLSLHGTMVLSGFLNAGWLVGTCWTALRLCRLLGLSPQPFLPLAAVLLLVRPITSEFLLGQVNLLWGLLLAAFLLLETTRRPWLAALSLALAISLKVSALAFLPYLALRRHWATLGRTLAWLAGLNLAAAWWLLPASPLQLFATWCRVMLDSGAERAFEIGNQSLLALTGRLLRADGLGLNVATLPDAAIGPIAAAVWLLLFAGLVVPRRLALPPASRTILDGALLTVLVVVGTPICWVATYSALLTPVTICLALLWDAVARRRLSWSTACAAVIAGLCSLMTHSKFWKLVGIRHIRGESYVYLVLMVLPLFALALAFCLWRQRATLATGSRG